MGWELLKACHIPGRLSRGFAALRASHPFPLAAGVLAKQGLATLRVPFPCPLAAGALAKLWEIKELRGRGRDSVYAQGLTKASF